MKGADEWLDLFNRSFISPFPDGRYIYVVIPGGVVVAMLRHLEYALRW